VTDGLNSNTRDHLVSVLKGALGEIPLGGSLLAELASVIVPQQRIDRLVDFVRHLDARIASVDQEAAWAKLADENFADLFEETALEAVRAVTEKRREYLAATLAAGLHDALISFVERKHLLRILGQINDIEVIHLRAYVTPQYLDSDVDEFRKMHKEVLKPIPTHDQSTDDEHNKRAFQVNYLDHLESLGLIDRPLKIDSRTKQPVYDSNARTWSTETPRVTRLGKLLLTSIGF
jgi:hypothetical protein